MKRRPYRKSKRAEDEERTRVGIIDAAEALHGTLGPARTTVSAVAQHAGVTRATVYRHFPDDESLFLACSSQWLSKQRLPEPDAWAEFDDPLDRLRAGLADIYRYFRDGAAMLALVQRDADALPQRVKDEKRRLEGLWLERLLEPFPGRGRKTLRAAVAHATSFQTWRSLCAVEGLSDRSAVNLMTGMVSVTCDSRPQGGSGTRR